MATTEGALTALFGNEPHTALPEDLLTWEPTPALAKHLAGEGVLAFVRRTARMFCSDPAYLDEVTASATQARSIRQRVASRKSNQEDS